MGGLPGPRRTSEESRESQRAGVQRGMRSRVPLQSKGSEFDAVLRLAGRHSTFKEGSVEVPSGVFPVEQHDERERGHPKSQNVSLFSSTIRHKLVRFGETAALFCRDEYFRMKVQWKSVSEEQEMRNSLLRGYRSLIGEDVRRTARRFGRIRQKLTVFALWWQRET